MSDHQSLSPAAEKADAFWGRIDMLIHNAGISQRSPAADTDYAVLRKIMDTNFIGAAELTRYVIPNMIAGGAGRIAVVGSIAGKFSTPYRSVYSASKMAMQGYFDALRAETAPFGIQVTMLILGGIRTDISRRALKGDGTPYGRMDPLQSSGMAPDACAEQILDAVMKGKREVVIGLTAKTRLALFLARFFPSVLARMLQKAEVT
jgi:short-subunit dehydrogenase